MLIKGLSLIFLGFGIFLLIQVVMPYLSFKIWEISFYQQNFILTDPTPTENVLGVAVENIGNFPAIISYSNRYNLPYHQFRISISSIDLKDAQVVVESNDFEKKLAHLPGSALPGEKGNVFITGHSSLTQFFRPGSFKPIFINLPKIKKGDEVKVEVGGQVYNYQVMEIRIVDPKDVSVINPPDGLGRYLSLMTCVPPGFNSKRLIVLAKLM